MLRSLDRALPFALPALAAVACGPAAHEPASPSAPKPQAVTARPSTLGPPRWVASLDTIWIERSDSGLDRLIVGSRRIEARGADVTGASKAAAEELEGGTVAPPWTTAGGGPAKYVFWHEGDVYGASEFLGELKPLGKLPAPVTGSFDWLDGTGLLTAAGAFVVRPAGGAPVRLDLPGVTTALAVDARRALALSVFGHARLTLDGGATFRDVSAELPEATRLEARGDDLHVLLRGQESRLVDARGAIISDRAPAGTPRHEPPPDLDDRWPEDADASPLEAAAARGLLLPDGDAITTTEGVVARVDLRTGRATALADVPPGQGDCAPFRGPEGMLLVCQGEGRASVVDVSAVPRVERSFDLEGAPSLDRFVGTDGEALGFLGPCAGRAPPSPADVVSTASPSNSSNQRSPVFCARSGPGIWTEHRLDPADASDVVAWIPRPGGSAIAIVALPGSFVHGVPRVSVRGGLRVVRVARNEPPLNVTTYMTGDATLLSRGLRALPDDTIEGWIVSGHGPNNLASVTIDPEGHARQRPAPARTLEIVAAGRHAVSRTEDERLFETTDGGRTWRPIEPPPGNAPIVQPSCSEVGCYMGDFVRVGWGGATNPLPPPEPRRDEPTRPVPAPPITRLACHFTGPPDGKRITESFGLGVTKSPVPRMAPGRIGASGALLIPWTGQQSIITGDAEIAFLPLFDLAAPIRRATVPLARLGPTPFHPFEVRLGYLLDEASTVRPVIAGSFGRCPAPLIDESGMTLPLGGCVEDPTVGVVLGRRALLVHQGYGQQVITAVDLPPAPGKARGPQLVTPGARRELATRKMPPEAKSYTMAAGLRQGAPVTIALDASGAAVLAPLDPERGTLGAEERMASLTDMLPASDPRCAARPDDARVVLPFDSEIGLVPGALPGVSATGSAGLAIIRWSSARACLEAVDISVRDERHEIDVGYYEPPGTVRKVIARFDGASRGTGVLAVMTQGAEIRQPLACDGLTR
ncbi:hypothetical protein [Polyangium aurulentum]|uniref:hypothetical protein n=1 Tax=Polyangium aurulentum TaxID=2567896 RepID=UPI0010AE3F94|nr:hypothetical protein [Polyangium aurulentum]UQA59476.1 hypothetical protein E8A73_002905 [Polyangium aurulentum]